MPYRPKLDPKVDLAGATPETLVQALFRRAPHSATTKEQPDQPAEQAGRVMFQRGSPPGSDDVPDGG